MRTSFKQFMYESIEDKGILKAIFVIGIPGAGKSYTVAKMNGSVTPRVVNTDRATEYLAKKFGKMIDSKNWPEFKDTTHRLTTNALFGYLNGVLPLFIDGTSNDASNILARAGLLESLGYDVGMVFVDAPLDIALKRAEERGKKINRDVDVDFIKKVHKQSAENKEYFKSKFHFFKEVSNSDDLLTDEAMDDAFKKVQAFYDSPVQNPVGKRVLEKMKTDKQKYLVPSVFEKDQLIKKLEGWYRS